MKLMDLKGNSKIFFVLNLDTKFSCFSVQKVHYQGQLFGKLVQD